MTPTRSANGRWLSIALFAQLGWGAYPVLLRYLQTISGLPSLALLAMGNLLVLLPLTVYLWPRLDKKLLTLPVMWLYGLMVVLRGITNLLATRYTLAIYVQLIYLLTPFIVALLCRAVFKEQLPRHTFKALTITLFGALLVMSGHIDQTAVATAVNRQDWLGIGLAFASSIFLALYMIVTRRTANHNASGESVLFLHLLWLFAFSALTSLLLAEPWQPWLQLNGRDWFVFLLFSVGVLLGSNLGQIGALQKLGAPLMSSLMPIRLISALLFAAVLLNEALHSWWQLLGTAVVILTLTWYLRQQ